MRVVLDTNVFVSGIHWDGPSGKVLQAWMDGRFTLVISLPIIEELVRVLSGFKVKMDPEEIVWFETLLKEHSDQVYPVDRIQVVKDDPDDDKFFDAALEGEADYIVSQDRHLLDISEYAGVKVVDPVRFLELLD